MADDVRLAWLSRVLGIRFDGPGAAPAPAASMDEQAPAPTRGIAYRKLLLRWREAQSGFDANLATLGITLLGRADIQAHPRFDDIRSAVAQLPKIVPAFGGRLEDVLDAGLNASDPAEQARLSGEGVVAIDAYRQQLRAAAYLLQLEQFAASELGRPLPLHGALDQALLELRAQLAA